MNIYIKGGRGRAGAGRRGEDGETYMFYMNYIKGGRGRAGAGRRWKTGDFHLD